MFSTRMGSAGEKDFTVIFMFEMVMCKARFFPPIKYDTGYPHDGRADNAAYRHDRRADKRRYPHDREIDIQS